MFFQDLQTIFNVSITTGQIVGNLLVSFTCGLLISLFYRWTYKGPNYSRTFVNSLILMSMITSIVIVVIGNNLARAFGLVGAMSIIRFRTPIKDAQDIVFIFFSLAVGLASGVGLYSVALTGTIMIGIVILSLNFFNYGSASRKEYLLQFSYDMTNGDEPSYLAVFQKFCKENKLVNVRSMGTEKLIELSYYVTMKNEKDSGKFVKEFRSTTGVKNVNLFFDNEKEL